MGWGWGRFPRGEPCAFAGGSGICLLLPCWAEACGAPIAPGQVGSRMLCLGCRGPYAREGREQDLWDP